MYIYTHMLIYIYTHIYTRMRIYIHTYTYYGVYIIVYRVSCDEVVVASFIVADSRVCVGKNTGMCFPFRAIRGIREVG